MTREDTSAIIIEKNGTTADDIAVVEAQTSSLVITFVTLWDQAWLRRLVLLVLMCIVWEWYARQLANPLMLPTFGATLAWH